MRRTLLGLILTGCSAGAFAITPAGQNIIRISAPILSAGSWEITDARYGGWVDSEAAASCGSWLPSASTVASGTAFTQKSNCWVDQERSVQDQEQNLSSKAIRSVGKSYLEYQTVIRSMSRQAVGSMASWVAADPVYSTWYNNGPVSNCGEWSPQIASGYTASASINQTSLCEQKQTANVQKREQNSVTGQYRNVGSLTQETRTVGNVAAQRTYQIAFGGWSNKGRYDGCSNWSPDPSTVENDQYFSQTATDCVQKQYRTHMEYYTDPSTGVRVMAVDTEEYRDIFVSDSRGAYGTKPLK